MLRVRSRRITLRRDSAYTVLLLILLAPAAAAQAPPIDSPWPPPLSMGQPPRLRSTIGPMAGYDFERDEETLRFFADLISTGRLPQFGIGEQSVETSLGASGSDLDWRLAFNVKVPLVSIGAEYSSHTEKVAFLLSARFTPRRGGIFGRGDLFRIDYQPWRQRLSIGVAFRWPFATYRRTRPRHTHVELPRGHIPDRAAFRASGVDTTGLTRSLDRIDHAVAWMDRLLTPRFETGDDFQGSAEAYRLHIRQPGHTFIGENNAYHRELDRAFTIATRGNLRLGSEMATMAEQVIFEDVVVPFNQLFGQNKKPHHADGYAQRAIADFRHRLDDRSAVFSNMPGSRDIVEEVFRRTVYSIGRTTRASRKRWKQSHLIWLQQSRLVWLPLNYGLRPEQYDTQGEWDRVVSMLTGERFTRANTATYLLNNQFHIELKEMIRHTRHYQVMVIHDFKGRYGKNETDRVGWDVVTEGYMRAFIDAIGEIDHNQREQIPVFMIFLDENFYQANKSRQIMTYLENLYDTDDVELENKDVQRRVNATHAELVRAIRGSPALRSESEDRLRQLFKVHVSITNPFDPSFRWDVVMRDHRKIAFRDVFEDDPGSGAGILTGQGIGEGYVGPAWEDRSILVRGPALVSLKTIAREVFLSQGYKSDDVPFFLRARDRPGNYADTCRALQARGWTTPMLTTWNDTGYGDKKSTVLKAVMYNLLPAGSVLYSFDSLWISDFWAGMFIAAALRGASVFPIAPAAKNAPSSARPTLLLMRETLDMMLRARVFFAEDIVQADGSIRVGLYAHSVPVDDVPARISAFLDGMKRYPFLRDRFDLHPTVLEGLARSRDRFEAADGDTPAGAPTDESDVRPFIHLKAHLMMSAAAARILSLPEWVPVLRKYAEIRAKQVKGLENEGVTPAILNETAPGPGAASLRTAYNEHLMTLSPEERAKVIFMMTIGSHNQDRRGMLLDGEVLLAVSGYDCLISLTDFMFITGTAAWPENPQELDDVFPKQGGPGLFKRTVRLIQDLI